MIGIIFLVLLLATLWTAVIALSLPVIIALVPTLLVVLAVVALLVWRKVQTGKAAQDIEKSLKAQSESQVKGARPDLQPEIQQLQAEFQKAVASLKSSKLARGGNGINALSVLPWYVIIGPPGAGKSTALRNSGLRFPYLSARGGGVRGVGGTRNCEWWLTNEAVILDTAGRYTTEDDDHEEWIAFVDMLVRTRPRKPINGLLVAVSLGDFVELTPEASAEMAHRLRERVDEVMGRLKMNVPVYLMFTKCDMIAGFVELFGHLGKNERGQIWGFTLPMEGRTEPVGDLFAQNFDELTETVGNLSLRQLGQSRRVEDRERIFQFPAQLEALKPNLVEFVQTLFAENIYQDSPIMRGVYFTSGTQEGRPIDRMMNAMASAFGIADAIPQQEKPVEAKSYFLRDVFNKVIFPDQGLAVRSASELKRQKVRQYAISGGLAAFALFVFSLPTVSYFKNRELIDRTKELVATMAKEPPTSGTAALTRLTPLRLQLAELLESSKQGAPWSMRLGMYQGDDVLAATKGFYATMARQVLISPVMVRDAQSLRSFIASESGQSGELAATKGAPHFDELKLHLLLSAPREATEPALSPALQDWTVRQLTRKWHAQFGGGDEAMVTLKSELSLHVQLVADSPALASSRDADLVRRARQTLKRMPIAALALQKVVSDLEREDYDLPLSTILGGGLPELRGSEKVRGAFTRRAYEEKVRDQLDNGADAVEAWVLASDPKQVDQSRLVAELRSLYFQAYIAEWRGFLQGLQLQVPSGDTLALLEDLTGGEPAPLSRLFRAVAYNTSLLKRDDLGEATSELKNKALNAISNTFGETGKKVAGNVVNASQVGENGERLLTARDVRDAFAGFARFGAPPEAAPSSAGTAPPSSVPLDTYQEQLQFVRDAMRAAKENAQEQGALAAKLETAKVRVRALIDSQEVGWRPRLSALLSPPIDSSVQTATDSQGQQADQKWCSTVFTAFRQNMLGRYPFNKDGQDATLADVADFFRPASGTLWAFYDSDLKNDVQRMGDRFALTARGTNPYKPQILAFLTKAQDLSSSLFEPNAKDAAFEFTFHIQPLPRASSVTFTLDGASIEYRNGPEEWYSAKWPGDGKTVGASIKVHSSKDGTDSVVREGEWGLFRLMEAASAVKSTPGSPVFTVIWHFDRFGDLAIDFRPKRGANPLFGVPHHAGRVQMMEPFRAAGIIPPQAVSKRGQGCPL